jgi:outer membrane receptor protein involved in Fe transport
MTGESRFAISPVAAAVAAALYPAQDTQAQENAGDEARAGALEEVVVTARKRTESAQDIPIAIQALSQDTLAAMGAKSMEDFTRFTPSVNVVTYSNSASVVIFRGAITGPGYIAASTSSVYLDEIALTTTGAQPSVRMVDIERVEALAGPQGTIFGSDAQAGTLRIVTNKPVMNEFEAVFDGELRGGSDSDLSYRSSVVMNFPLVEDTLALRLVGYADKDGGFIDNVYGHTPDTSVFNGPDFFPSGFGTLDNAASVEDNWNDSDVYGLRASMLWNVNDNWSVNLGYFYQDSDSGADNYYDPYVGDLEVVRFHDEYTEDKFDVFSLTIEADLGFAQLVSATSYYDRENNYLSDVTSYAHYWNAAYCKDSGYTPSDFPYYDFFTNPDTGAIMWWPVYCHASTVDGDSLNAAFLRATQDRFTQEIRLSAQGDRLDWLVGLFYETANDDWQSSFAGPTTGGDGLTNLYQDSISLAYYEFTRGTTYPTATSHWYSASQTDWEQKAIFGEATWHMTDKWDLTLGGRYYDRSNTNYYFVNHPGAFDIPAMEDVQGRKGVDEEFIPKVSLSYKIDDSKMVYGLYTQGKRPGGINRTRGEPFFPSNYVSDLMDNYEVGYKSNFAQGRGRFNVTAYKMIWSDYQLELADPSSVDCINPDTGVGDPSLSIPGVCGQPWQRVVANAGDAHISGLNIELDYVPNANWVLGMNAEWMEAETDTSQDLDGNGTDDLVAGLRLPLVPEFKASAWAEYHWTLMDGSYDASLRTQWSYSGDTLNMLEPIPLTNPNPQLTNASYTIGDLRFSISRDDWQASVFINNLTDERAQYTINTGQYEWGMANLAEGRPHLQRIFTSRPREFGVQFTKRWE